MKDLAESIANEITAVSTVEPCFLRDAAVKWSAHSLGTFDGETLDKALAISAALANFCNELESP